jgi:4-amino-4-deoxychorismate lyase
MLDNNPKISASYAWLNGKKCDSLSCIPVSSRALWYGDGVFETIASINGIPLKPTRHLERLRIGAASCDLDIPWSDDELLKEIYNVSTHIKDRGVLRLMVYRGGNLGLHSQGSTERLILLEPALNMPDQDFKEGLSVKLKMTSKNVLKTRKSLDWSDTIIALRRAARQQFSDILWHDPDSGILEASSSNVFFLGREGDLVEVATPPLNTGILPGTTREILIELLNSAKIPVTERQIFAEELPRFDECFLTSSVRGLCPVTRINNHNLFTLRKNSTFQHIHRLYQSWIHSQVGLSTD